MVFSIELGGRYIRVVAIIALMLGLNDASRLLGVSTGNVSPITVLGPAGFTYLTIFALSLLFASVGLWIKASWGAVLLVGATSAELAMYLLGSPDVKMTPFGFAVRLVLLASLVLIFLLGLKVHRERVHD
jgi:hypothetical protein